MSRPRSVSDRRVFEALRGTIGAAGPAGWTLRQVADRAGLSPPTLVQRFGSKRALLTAYLDDLADRAADAFPPGEPDDDPLDRLQAALLDDLGGAEADPASVGHWLALRQIAAADPELRLRVRRAARRRRKAIRKLLNEAVAAGQLRRSTRVRKLARAVEVTAEGAAAGWTIHRTRSLRQSLRREIQRVLGPWLRR
ncbi:MAG: TetR/AcrR family transcriptional regulator [Gemmatimonadetes bacterium]|nr:TetR/AcrR family transcriptional regulator [Gemmatimonadota bacterium]NNF39141.1 TetR/AcrR family transcriptional regulator [Gemmatimonadota bacterium]